MDTGSKPEVLDEIFGDLVDLSETTEHWNKNVGIFASNPETMILRASKLRQKIRDRSEKEIVLVSHGVFLHAMAGNYSTDGEQLTRQWENTECRSYTFNDDEEATLVETEESIQNRPDLKYHPPQEKVKDSPMEE